MVVNFTVKTSSYPATHYDALLNISRGFIEALAENIGVYGYTIIDTETGGMPTYTSRVEAQNLKKFCYDFRIEKGGRLSRDFRIESPLKSPVQPFIGILEMQPSKKKKEFREHSMMKAGRSNFLDFYRQREAKNKHTIKWNGKLDIMTPKTYYFSAIVNDELLIVHGGNAPTQSDSCVYGNYISLIKCYHLYKKLDNYILLSNGVYGVADSAVMLDIPLNTKSTEQYSKLGIQLKVRYSRDPEYDYGCSKIMVVSSVNDFARPPTDEPYRVLHENIYRRSGSVMRVMSTLPGITTKMAAISVE